MPQFRFDSCASYTGLSPDVEIRRVTFEPSQNAEEAQNGYGVLTVNNSFIERVTNQAQDTWFDDVEAQKYITSRVILSTSATLSQLIVRIVNVINADRRGDSDGTAELRILQTLYFTRDGQFNFTEEQANLAASILGLEGTHERNGQIHPGLNHSEMEIRQIRMRVCIDLLKSGVLEEPAKQAIRFATGDNLDVEDYSLTQIYESLEGQVGALERTIGDDGEEIRRADLPLSRFYNAQLETDHITVFCFSFVNTDLIRAEFDQQQNNNILDFTYSKISTATVASNVYIRPILETAEQIEQADQEVLAPQNGIFQDLRGLYSLSGQAIQGGDQSQRGLIQDSPVDLSGFEDEIRSMSVDVEDSIYAILARDAVVFSDLWASRRRNDEIDLAFAFNEQRFLQQNSLFPKLFNEEAFSEMARNLGSGITRMQIYKYQVEPNNNLVANSLGTTSRNAPSRKNQEKEIIGTSRRGVGDVREFTGQINLGARGGILQGMRFFTTTDFHETEEERANASGKKFEYGIEIDYLDSTVDMLLMMVNALLEQENNLRRLVNNMGTLPSSNPEEITMIHEMADQVLSEIDYLVPIMNALSTAGVLQGTGGDLASIIETLKGNADMTVYERAEGVQRISDLFGFYGGELENELRRAVPGIQVYPGDDSPENATAYITNANSGQSAARSVVTKQYTFKNIVETTNSEGYDYLNTAREASPNVGLEIKNLTDFIARADQEVDKYFNNPDALAGIEDTKIKYFTPATIVDSIGGDILQNPAQAFDYERYSNFTANVLERGNLKQVGNQNKIIPDSPNLNGDNTTISLTNQLAMLGAKINLQAPSNKKNVNLSNLSAFNKIAFGSTTGSEGNLQQSDIDQQSEREQFVRLEAEDVRQLQVTSQNIYKPLMNILGPIKISSENNGANKLETKNSFTKVVLDMDEETLADISDLPNQVKAMIKIVTTKFNGEEEEFENYRYNFDEIREIRGPRGQLTGLTDPMRDYKQFASYWLNFKQIKKVEILTSFNRTNSNGYDIANPVWREIDVDDINRLGVNQFMLCRFSSYTERMAEIIGATSDSGLDLPTYNEYFFLTRAEGEENIRLREDREQPVVPIVNSDTLPENIPGLNIPVGLSVVQREPVVAQGELDRNRSELARVSEQIRQFDPVQLQQPIQPIREQDVRPVRPIESQVQQLGETRLETPSRPVAPVTPRQQFRQIVNLSFGSQRGTTRPSNENRSVQNRQNAPQARNTQAPVVQRRTIQGAGRVAGGVQNVQVRRNINTRGIGPGIGGIGGGY